MVKAAVKKKPPVKKKVAAPKKKAPVKKKPSTEEMLEARREAKENKIIAEHPLMSVFIEAVKQAAYGKGAERHGTVEDFLSQPIFWIGHSTGPRGLMFQVFKKTHEAIYCYEKGSFTQEEAIDELLGASVYLASLIILLHSDGTGMENFQHPAPYTYTHAVGNELIEELEEEEEEEWEKTIGFDLKVPSKTDGKK